MNRLNHTILLPAILAAVAGISAGSPAFACDKESKSSRNGATDPMVEIVRIAAQSESTKSEQTWSDDKNEIKIIRKNGKQRVYLNGKEVMELDEDLSTAHLADEERQRAREMGRGEVRRLLRNYPTPPASPLAPAAPVFTHAFGGGEVPKVMIGITMDTAEAHGVDAPKGFEADQVTVITRVLTGLPAEQAGLKEGDVVLQVNGSATATPSVIREVIQSKNPGDDLRLRIFRDGKEQDLAIKLAAYDRDQLGSPRIWGWSDEDAAPLTGEQAEKVAKLRAEMASTSDQLRELGAKMGRSTSDEEREKLSRQMSEAGSRMGEIGGEIARMSGQFGLGEMYNFRLESFPRMRIERGRNGGFAWVLPPDAPQPTQPSTDSDSRFQKLDERLERLEKLIEKAIEKESNR